MLEFIDNSQGCVTCRLNLQALYRSSEEIKSFNTRWEDFFSSDKDNPNIFQKTEDAIIYQHKSWIPNKTNENPSLLLLFGNPAPQSVYKDVYFAYEGSGIEHRFWKVLRDVGYADLSGKDPDIKEKFFNLHYNSPFRLGFEVIYTFPSSASKPKWSGVMGLERLFGKKALNNLLEPEKKRLQPVLHSFLNSGGIIIAMQKDAYNAVSTNTYNIKLATKGELVSRYDFGIAVIGTPPTRWMHTKVMKKLLTNIKTKYQ